MAFETLAPLTFIRQTFKDFRNTGSVAPSSPFLAKAMVKCLPHPEQVPGDYRVLEVGPGTGPFTKQVAKRLSLNGHFDLYEISDIFSEHLERLIRRDKALKRMGDRVNIYCADVLELPPKPIYDAVISGLPFNNFTPDQVRIFLEHFGAVLKPGGTLTFFEYFAIRRLQAPFVSQKRRSNLREIGKVVREFAKKHQFRQSIVPLNLLPARVRHLRFMDGKW